MLNAGAQVPGVGAFQISGIEQDLYNGPYYGGTGGIATSSSTTINLPYPDNIENGDYLFIHIWVKTGDDAVNTPSGWTVIYSGGHCSDSYINFRKLATGSESGSLSISCTSSANRGAIMYLYKNGTTLAGIDAEIISDENSQISNGLSGDANELQTHVCYLNEDITATTNAITQGATENSNLSTSDLGGFTFVNVTYNLTETETTPDVTFSFSETTCGFIHKLLLAE